MATETPLATVNRLYGSKQKLIDSIASDAKASDEDAGEAKQRLATVSNHKLLRIAEVTKHISADHGSRDKLIAAVATAHGKGKDNDYLESLKVLPGAQLLDLLNDKKKPRRRRR